MQHSSLTKALSYHERSLLCTNFTARQLFQIMEKKRSNLCVAADVTRMDALLQLARVLGPFICAFKTHIDIIVDYNKKDLEELQRLAEVYDFLLFEDRKFADIGKTVQEQYEGGLYNICSWAHIVNAHAIPGPGIIEGLRKRGMPLQRGLLLLAEMSSAGTLAKGSYTQATVAMAEEYPDFVIGFICQHKLANDPRYIHMTPGVNLATGKATLGQQYNSPEHAIVVNGTDVIIVGSGIIHAQDPLTAAQHYQHAGWESYQQRLLS